VEGNIMDNTFNEENWFELVTNECRSYPVTPSRNCIDIGANVGGFVEAHKDKIRNFFCVEPGSANVGEIKDHHSDLIESGRMKICNRAVHKESNSSLKLKRYATDGEGRVNSGSNSTLVFQFDVGGHGWSDKPDEYEDVKTINFEDVMAEACSYFGSTNIDLLKVDCEGAEYDFLMDKDLHSVESIVMEIHNFLDHFPSKTNPSINQRYDLIQHILKTHDLIQMFGMPPALQSDIIAKDKLHPAHGILQFRRKL
jgi:FkbM family methyltransferase